LDTPERVGITTPSPSYRFGSGSWRRFVAWARRSWIPILLVGVALASTTTITLSHTERLSAYDEWVYYDYVAKVPTQGVVHQGEYIGEPALEIMACFGDPYGARGEPCTGPNGHYSKHSQYPLAGKTTADLYTPFYFATTWAGAQAIQFFTGTDLLTAARLTGFFWLGGGLIVFYGLGRLLKLHRLTILGLGLLAIGDVSAQFTYTYITTDAPSFFFGALLLYFGVRFVKGRAAYGWWLIPLSALAVLFKITNIFAVGLIAVYMLVYAIMKWRERSIRTPSPPRIILVTVLYVLAAVAAELGWLVIRSAIAVGPGPNQGVDSPLSIRGVASQLTAFLGLHSARTVNGALNLPFAALTIVGVLGFLLTARGNGTKRALSIAIPTSMVVFAPLLLIAMGLALGAAFPISPRYAGSLTAGILLSIGFVIKNNFWRYTLIAYGGAIVIAAIVRTVIAHDLGPIIY
jgi:hypothetical protein